MSDTPSRIGAEPYGSNKTDPTALTTDQLQREIAHAAKLFETQVKAHADVNKEKIDALTQVMTEHNKAVAAQLAFLENQRLEQKADTKQAVIDALAAAKEAVTITATNTKEQIAALQTSFATEIKALSEKLDDVKNQVTSNVALIQGSKEGKTAMSDSLKLGLAIISGLILMIGFFIAQRGG